MITCKPVTSEHETDLHARLHDLRVEVTKISQQVDALKDATAAATAGATLASGAAGRLDTRLDRQSELLRQLMDAPDACDHAAKVSKDLDGVQTVLSSLASRLDSMKYQATIARLEESMRHAASRIETLERGLADARSVSQAINGAVKSVWDNLKEVSARPQRTEHHHHTVHEMPKWAKILTITTAAGFWLTLGLMLMGVL